ncbi:unnamed protein product, partial [Protopolystoma xenopodis]
MDHCDRLQTVVRTGPIPNELSLFPLLLPARLFSLSYTSAFSLVSFCSFLHCFFLSLFPCLLSCFLAFLLSCFLSSLFSLFSYFPIFLFSSRIAHQPVCPNMNPPRGESGLDFTELVARVSDDPKHPLFVATDRV